MGWLDCGLGALLFCTGYAFLPSFSYFQLLFSTVWVFVLNQLVPLKANELNAFCPLIVWVFSTLSLGTFLQECSYRLLGKMSVQM